MLSTAASAVLQPSATIAPRETTSLSDYDYDFLTQNLSEAATRGMLKWLRPTGCPRSGRPI